MWWISIVKLSNEFTKIQLNLFQKIYWSAENHRKLKNYKKWPMNIWISFDFHQLPKGYTFTHFHQTQQWFWWIEDYSSNVKSIETSRQIYISFFLENNQLCTLYTCNLLGVLANLYFYRLSLWMNIKKMCFSRFTSNR